MYTDMVIDGCLKGLGEMMYSMAINITEALLCVLLVIFLVPRWALWGYIVMIYFGELFNFALSLQKLLKKAY